MEIGPRRGQVGAVACEDLLDQVGVSLRSLKGRVFTPSGRLDAGQATRKKDQALEVKKQAWCGQGVGDSTPVTESLERGLKAAANQEGGRGGAGLDKRATTNRQGVAGRQ